MSIAQLVTRTVELRHLTSTTTDPHGSPVMTEQISQIRGHVQPSAGDVGQAEGTGEIGTRTATLYAIPPVTISVGDVVDDGVSDWIAKHPPRPHTRPGSVTVHHVSVDLAWSAPSSSRAATPTVEEWESSEW